MRPSVSSSVQTHLGPRCFICCCLSSSIPNFSTSSPALSSFPSLLFCPFKILLLLSHLPSYHRRRRSHDSLRVANVKDKEAAGVAFSLTHTKVEEEREREKETSGFGTIGSFLSRRGQTEAICSCRRPSLPEKQQDFQDVDIIFSSGCESTIMLGWMTHLAADTKKPTPRWAGPV